MVNLVPALTGLPMTVLFFGFCGCGLVCRNVGTIF
jgi:hypothetical protein